MSQSSLQKQINRLRKYCVNLTDSNTLRKRHIQQFDSFIKKLLKEKRITKDELSSFMVKK